MDQREEQEFAEYFVARREAVRRMAYMMCGDGHHADDLAQTTFVALHRHWRKVRDKDALDARVGCAPGSRNAAFVLRDGASVGSVAVVVNPAGAPPEAQPGMSQLSDGTRQVTSNARSGQILTVLSIPDAGSPRPPTPTGSARSRASLPGGSDGH